MVPPRHEERAKFDIAVIVGGAFKIDCKRGFVAAACFLHDSVRHFLVDVVGNGHFYWG